MIIRKYNEATTIDGVPLLTRNAMDYKVNPTLATGDVQISKDGGAFANITTLPVVTPAAGTSVLVSLSATEAQAKHIIVRFIDQTSPKEWEDQEIIVETFGNASAQFTGDINNLDATVSSRLASASYTAPDNTSIAAILTDTGTTLDAKLNNIQGATFDTATDSLEALRNRGDAAWITATGFSTHTAADTWAVATRVLTAGTNIVLAKGTGVTGFNDLSAAQVNTEADTALTDYGASTPTDVLTQVNAALDAAGTELTAIPTTTGTIRQKLNFVFQYFRNKKTVTSTTEILKKEDASTTLGTATVSDDGTTFTKGEMN